MKKSLLVVSTLPLLLLISCASQEPSTTTPVKVEDNSNRFRTINTQTDRVGTETVICHNCQAQFKLSKKILKISMKGNTIITCPICHQNYLKKEKK